MHVCANTASTVVCSVTSGVIYFKDPIFLHEALQFFKRVDNVKCCDFGYPEIFIYHSHDCPPKNAFLVLVNISVIYLSVN